MGLRMAIRSSSIQLIHKILDDYSIQDIIEYGNAYIRSDAREWIKNNKFSELDGFTQGVGKYGDIISKEYFEAMGYNHTSIDLNGKEGSLPLNLCEPVTVEETADLLIDCGTTQHVENQYQCFTNAFNLIKIGGVIIHVLPRKGYWLNHSQYKYTTQFFIELCAQMKYKIIAKSEPSDLVQICIQKTKDTIPLSEEQFNTLPIHVEDTPVELLNDRALYPYAYKRR